MALQLLHGDIEQLRREYMVLFTRGVSITRKLGFSDVIMPGNRQREEEHLALCFHPAARKMLHFNFLPKLMV